MLIIPISWAICAVITLSILPFVTAQAPRLRRFYPDSIPGSSGYVLIEGTSLVSGLSVEFVSGSNIYKPCPSPEFFVGYINCSLSENILPSSDTFNVTVFFSGLRHFAPGVFRTGIPNSPPTAPPQTITLDQNTDGAGIQLLATDSDANETFRYYITQFPSNGVLLQSRTFQWARIEDSSISSRLVRDVSGTVVYVPNLEYWGNDTFEFQVFDRFSQPSITTVVSIVVKEVFFVYTDRNVSIPLSLCSGNCSDLTSKITGIRGGVLLYNENMISTLPQTINGTTVTFVPGFSQSLATQVVGSVNYRLSNNPWTEKTVRIPIGPPGIFNITVGTTQAMRVPIRLLCSYVRRPAEIITYRVVGGFNSAFGTLNQAIFRGVRLATPNDSFSDQNFVVGAAFENGVVNDLWGRFYYQPAPRYHGRFGFSYDCYDHRENLPSVPGFVNVTVIPQIPCNDRIEINSDYIKIYNGDPIADGLVFQFFEFPQDAMFMSTDSSIPAYRINTTTRYRENRVRLIANITRGRPFVGNYLYQAIGADNLTSNFCNVTFVVSCAPVYLNIFNKSSVSICETCPVGAICSFNGLFEPYAARGYWKALDSMIFLPCEPESACPGFSNATVCAEGYTGTRCGECSQGFYRLGGDCRKCTNNIGVLITLIMFLLFGAFALISLVLRYVANGWILGVATICLNFTQMILVLSEIKMKWTPEFQQFMNTISIANLNIELASPECFITDSASNYYFKMKVTLALPLFLSLPLILWTFIHLWPIRSSIIYACRWLAKRVRIRYNPVINLVALKQSQAENLLIATRAMNALLSVVYVIVATKSLALFDCTKEVNDTFYLDEDSSVKCFDDLWYSNLSYVLPAALFYAFGIPLYFSILFFLLFQRRWSGPTWTRLRKLAEAVFNFDYSFIKAERQYFIVLQILQKFIVICINMFFTKYVTLQITLTICVLIGSYQVYRRQQPYRYKSLHYLEVCSIFSAIAILAVGNFLYTEQFPAESHQQVVSAILIAIISVFFGAAVLAIMYEVKTGMKTRKQSSTSSLSLSSSLKNAKNEKQMKDTESTPTRPLEISNAVLIESTAGLPMMTASKFLYNRTVDRLPPKE